MRSRLHFLSAVCISVSLASGASADPEMVNMDFPERTQIRDIAQAVALWTGKPMILDRNASGKVEIHAPEKMSLEDAYKRFLVALEELGLSAYEHQGVVQILPTRSVTPEREAWRRAEIVPTFQNPHELVTVDFPEPTEIKDVIKDVAGWSGRRVILDRNVNGKVQIISPRKVSKESGYHIYLAALDQLGLGEVDRGSVVQVVPRTRVKHMRDPVLSAPPKAAAGDVNLNFPDVVEIRDVLEKARSWYGRELLIDQEVNGRLQILAPGPMPKDEAHKVLVAALDQLGLIAVKQGESVRILPYRELEP